MQIFCDYFFSIIKVHVKSNKTSSRFQNYLGLLKRTAMYFLPSSHESKVGNAKKRTNDHCTESQDLKCLYNDDVHFRRKDF